MKLFNILIIAIIFGSFVVEINSMIRKIKKSSSKGADGCFADNLYKPLNIPAACVQLDKLTVSQYKAQTRQIDIDTIKNECLAQHFRDAIIPDPTIPGKHEDGAPGILATKDCFKKNRFDETYSYKGGDLGNDKANYFNSAKYDGTFIVDKAQYLVYQDSPKAKGFIAATNAPIGDFRKIVAASQTINLTKTNVAGSVACGAFEKAPNSGCFSGNDFKNNAFTLENTIHTFYKNLLKHKIHYVVMLTNFAEQPQDETKCLCKVKADRYFAAGVGEVFKVPNHLYVDTTATVKTVSVDKVKFHNAEVRVLEFTDEDGKSKHTVTHIHFLGWLDFSVPADDQILPIIQFIKSEKDLAKNTIVHCTGGIGRTGTFIASVLTSGFPSDKKFNLSKFILRMREQRSQLVETAGQVELIIKNMLNTKVGAKKLKK
jgi:protein-tyrosine phosphatase